MDTPQEMMIHYWHSEIGQTLTKRITILDCDGDDPTCEEYYGLQGMQQASSAKEYANDAGRGVTGEDIQTNIEALNVVIYDMMGRKVDMGLDELYRIQTGTPRILIVTYWDGNGNFVKSEKVLTH